VQPWEPLIADSAMVLTRKIAKAAREQGIKILLSGAGADEWFGGYRRHAFFRNWLKLENNIPKVLKWYLFSGLRPGKLRWMNALDGSSAGLWQAAVSSSLNSSLSTKPLIPLPSGGDGELESMLRWDQNYYLPQDVLLMTDFAGMAEGIETRFPYLHPALTCFADSVPIARRMNGSPKAMLRNLYRAYFGNSLTLRKKQGFGISEPEWLSEEASRSVMQKWCSQLSAELPDFWKHPEWKNFQQAALESPGKFFQEWMRIGRLSSWLHTFRNEGSQGDD
jgi:asparagine synthase (glutamine-hydrolysing)